MPTLRAVPIQRFFGARVRELRLAANVRQEDLAEKCGLYRTYLSRIETGTANPTLTMIQALADSLDVSITALFPEVPPPRRVAVKAGTRRIPGSRGKVR